MKLRLFADMTNAEIAALLQVSGRTVGRHWRLAKVWLHGAMSNDSTTAGASCGKSEHCVSFLLGETRVSG